MKVPEQYRWANPGALYATRPGQEWGVFAIPHGGDLLICMATPGTMPNPEDPNWPRWDHVSVTVRNKRGVPVRRVPTWEQMCFVKGFFWEEHEEVMQLHPPSSDYVNNHEFCLHLWRPLDLKIPLPPSSMVGIKGVTLT